MSVLVANFKRGTSGIGAIPEESLRSSLCHMQLADYQKYDSWDDLQKIRNDPKSCSMQRRAYLSIILPGNLEPWLKDMMNPIPLDKMPPLSDQMLGSRRFKHITRLWLDDKRLETLVGINRKKLVSGDMLDWIDGTVFFDINDSMLLKSDGRVPSEYLDSIEMEDRAAVTKGSYTVGASGCNYATWTLAHGDVGNLTGNLTFTQKDNTTETGGPYPNKSLYGYTLLNTVDDSWHKGDFNNSTRKCSCSYSADSIFMYYGPPGANNGTIIYEKLNTVRTANGSYHWMFLLGGQNKTYTCYWRNLIYYSNGYIGGAFCFNDGFSKGTYIFHNLLSVAATNGALVFNGTAGLTVENSTVYGTVIGDNDSGYDIYEGASTYVNRNLASFDNVRYNSGLKGTIYNCATSFSSEPGFTRLGMKSSDVFMSTTMTDGDRFLRPKSLPPSPSKTLVYGTAPGIGANTYDISGKTRPAQKNVYWIGAKDGMIIPKKHISFQDPGIF